jgi:hypothetical protein
MSTYREIHGKAVKSVSTDPSAETDAGQIWYNTSSNTFKSIVATSAWSSASPMLTARYSAGSGTQTAALASGGYNGSNSALTEEYNGSGFSTGGALPVASRGAGAAGTQTATIYAGGYESSNTGEAYTYNGTAWTGIPALNTARRNLSQNMAGTTTAAIVAGGYTGVIADSEEYNGSSWSEGDNLNTARNSCAAGGIQTAAFLAGGSTGSPTAATELYDGTSWTTGGSLNTARKDFGGGGAQTAGIVFGGDTGSVSALTETFDGTSWTETGDMATARHSGAPANQPGANSSTLVAGGVTSDYVTTTEEWNTSTSVITAAAWSSGTAFPTNSSGIAGVGPRDAAMAIGGYPPGSPPTGKSFEYNGVAWSAEASLNPNTGTGGVSSAAGTQTAAICTQLPAGGAPYIAAGTYDGSSWSNAEDRPTSNYSDGSAGTLTAGLFFGGGSSPSAYTAATISYDGTDWTVEESMGTARTIVGGCGSSTAALAMGGVVTPPATLTNLTEEYGGESWTAGGVLLTTLRDHRASGPQTDAIVAGGRIQGAPPSTFLTACSRYDGTAWATSPNLAIARGLQGAGNGPVGAAWGAAGYYPGPPSGPTGNRTTSTEHFNVETTALNVKTITTS